MATHVVAAAGSAVAIGSSFSTSGFLGSRKDVQPFGVCTEFSLSSRTKLENLENGRSGNGGRTRNGAVMAVSVDKGSNFSHGEPEQQHRRRSVDRREILRLGSAIIVGSTLSTLVPFSFDKSDGGVANAADITQRFQRAAFLGKVKDKLRDAIKANPDLVPDLLKLAINDALTYDKATKTGGANGSIRFELNRPENAGLEKAVKFLEGIKVELDEKLSKFGSISWADLIQISAQSAAKRTFIVAAIKKCGGNEEKGLQLYTAYGSLGQWGQFDKLLGRADATGPDPEGRVPKWDTATPAEISARFSQVGIQPRYITALSAFLGPDQVATESKLAADEEYFPYVRKYRDSRQTVSQTDYEVDLINTFSKVSVLGQRINYEAYTYKPPPVQLRF
ncbi:unnamed protein product [Calypogeia fissa]